MGLEETKRLFLQGLNLIPTSLKCLIEMEAGAVLQQTVIKMTGSTLSGTKLLQIDLTSPLGQRVQNNVKGYFLKIWI